MTSPPPPSALDLGPGRTLAYHRIEPGPQRPADAPGIVFLGGFRSDMTGTKAVHLEDWARRTGRAFLRFDYRGHGASSARFEDGAIGDWADDAYEAASRLTNGPQILVGSSMGGWISCLLARRFAAEGAASRVAGFVGIAAAPDFTEDSMWAGFSDAERTALAMAGHVDLPNDYSDEPYRITRRLIEDGREHLVLRAPLVFAGPVRLLQGTDDADVSLSTALQLLSHLESPDARLTIVKGADHRMSEPRELALIVSAIEEVETARASAH